jgi:hypothetical protein
MGLHFFITGFFLKSVVANNIAGFGADTGTDFPGGIDTVWQGTAGYSLSTADHWAVAFLYYCQIYSDFAGYSLMALGMARLLGYRLPANFRSPMRAGTLQEFWQRWHITLSHWLRDYLYIPLGGGRASAPRVAVNVLITMLLGGLWHGAAWTFVIWGGMHGFGLVVERGMVAGDAVVGDAGVGLFSRAHPGAGGRLSEKYGGAQSAPFSIGDAFGRLVDLCVAGASSPARAAVDLESESAAGAPGAGRDDGGFAGA